MNHLRNEEILNLKIGIAYNPYLQNHFSNSDERERFKEKFSTGLVSSIWLQFGTDISLLEKEINYLKKYIKNTNTHSENNIKIIGSLLIPSRQFIARFRYRPWKGVYIAEKYINSLDYFNGFIEDLIDFYLENDIHPIIETECFTSEKLENIYNLFNK